MSKKLTDSVRRSARAILNGPEIFDYLFSAEGRQLLIEAADSGFPPVTAVSAQIGEICGGLNTAKLLPVRQYVGRCIRAVLAEEGFEVADARIRIKDPIFQSGASYQRITAHSSVDIAGLFRKMLDSLDRNERQALAEYLLKKTDSGPKRRAYGSE